MPGSTREVEVQCPLPKDATSEHCSMKIIDHPRSSPKSPKVSPSIAPPQPPALYGWGKIKPHGLQCLHRPQFLLFCLFMALMLQGYITNGILRAATTTLERRFHFQSFEIGMIDSSNDVGGLLMLLPIAYYGGKVHKGRWIGIGTGVQALGSLLCIVPHFAAGAYKPGLRMDRHCVANRTDTSGSAGGQESLRSWSAMFIVGQLFHGLGAAPFYTMSVTYLDENVSQKASNIYVGIYHSSALLGPMFGYLSFSLFNGIYGDIDKVNPKEIGMLKNDPRWYGAWWIGGLVSFLFSVITAFFILGFAPELPGKAFARRKDVDQAQTMDGEDAELKLPGCLANFSNFAQQLKRLLKNPIFDLLVLAQICFTSVTSGFASFLAKYFEVQFQKLPKSAALYVAGAALPAALFGTLIGAGIQRYKRLRCRGNIILAIIGVAASFVSTFGFMMTCETLSFAGRNANYPGEASSPVNRNLTRQCNDACLCKESDYQPVCGTLNGTTATIFSSCYAGCRTVHESLNKPLEYSDCDCFVNGTVKYGVCESTCSPYKFYLFMFSLTMMILCAYITMSPIQQATLRCVPFDTRTFAIAISMIIIRIFGPIPAAPLVGALIQTSCLEWAEKQEVCILYNNYWLAMILFIISMVYFAICLGSLCLALRLYKPSESAKLDSVSASLRGPQLEMIHKKSPAGVVEANVACFPTSCFTYNRKKFKQRYRIQSRFQQIQFISWTQVWWMDVDGADEDRLKKLYPFVDETKTPFPSCWNRTDKYSTLSLAQANTRIRVRGRGPASIGSVRSDHPIPTACGLYYFEVHIKGKSTSEFICIGISQKAAPLDLMPGCGDGSFGYGGTGKISAESGTPIPYGPTFSSGDVIGCGLNFVDNTCFYTKNGQNLGIAFRNLEGCFYPSVGLFTPGETVDVNFGRAPFVYNILDDIKEAQTRVHTSIRHFDLPQLKSDWLQALVSNYLVHHGFAAAAESFNNNNANRDFQDAANRQGIMKLVKSNNFDEAIQRVQESYPNLFEEQPELLLWLKCQEFLEALIRFYEEQRPHHSSSSSNGAVSKSTTSGEKLSKHSCISMTSPKARRSNVYPISNSLRSSPKRLKSPRPFRRSVSPISTELVLNGSEKLHSSSPEYFDPTTSMENGTKNAFCDGPAIVDHHIENGSGNAQEAREKSITDGDCAGGGGSTSIYLDASPCVHNGIVDGVAYDLDGDCSMADVSTPCTDGLHCDVGDENGGGDFETKGDGVDGSRLEHFVVHGRELFEMHTQLEKDGRNNATMKSCYASLRDSFNLIAFADPLLGSNSYKVDGTRREAFLLALNSAMLETKGHPSKSALDTMYAHARSLRTEMVKQGLGAGTFSDVDHFLAE